MSACRLIEKLTLPIITLLTSDLVFRRTDAEEVFSKMAKSLRAARMSDNLTFGSTIMLFRMA